MKKLVYFLPLLLLFSCSEEEEIFPVESTFTAYPKGYFIETSDGLDTIKLEYQNNQVTKRIGEWIQVSGSTGYTDKFSKLFETQISYSGNQAVLKKISTLSGVDFPNDLQTYTFNGKQISEAIFTYQNRPNYSEKYVYNYENNKLKNIDLFVTDDYYKNDLRSRRDFYFNTNGNLDSLVYRDAVQDYNEIEPSYIDYKSKMRNVTVFTNYDQSQNPFQSLGIFTDLFYKSLSKNNFRKISTIGYDKDGNKTGNVSESSWNYEYINGEVKVLK
jgi:hypothetical protein